jgi:cytochrome c-type biogenesis protein
MSMQERRRHLGRILSATTVFVLGFATIFTALGASASALGGLILENRLLLTRVGGTIVILIGLSVLGIIKIPGLYRERRFMAQRPPLGLLGAFPVGMAFGFAWIPCVGPVLAAVLTLAATSQTVASGTALLFAYSLGLGVPFLITALLMTVAFDTLGWLRRNARYVTAVSGAFLLVMGVAMVTDLLFTLNTWILRLVPFRPAI